MIMAVKIYCTIVIIVFDLNLMCDDLNLMFLLFCFTKSKMRYCPTAYTIAIAINAAKPQLVEMLIISEMLLSDISIINAEVTIEMMTKNILLLYSLTLIGKREVIF